MVEVSARTSTSTVLSGDTSTSLGGFDVRSWQGLTTLLHVARNSEMNGEAYGRLRDIIMQYAQEGGSNASLREQIETEIKKLNLTVPQKKVAAKQDNPPVAKTPERTVAVQSEERPVSRTSFGSARTAPDFRIQQSVPSASVQPEIHSVERIPASPEKAHVPENLPRMQKKNNVVSEKKVTTPPEEKVAPVPEQNAPKTVVHKEKEVVQVPPAPAPVPKESSASTQTVEDYKLRIAEIKRTVLAEIGNPITLTDGSEPVGRTYMKALVGALKAVSGNAPGTLTSSMKALEDAFVRVRTVGAQPQKEVATPVAPQSVSPSVTQPKKIADTPSVSKEKNESPVEEQSLPKEVVAVAPKQEDASEEHASKQKTAPDDGTSDATSQQEVVPEKSVQRAIENSTSSASSSGSPAIPSLADTLKDVPLKKSDVTPGSRKSETLAPTHEPIQTAEPHAENKDTAPKERSAKERWSLSDVTSAKNAPSVPRQTGSDTQPKTATQPAPTSTPAIPTPQSKSSIVPDTVAGDLHTPEMDEGLNRLLNEWSIFKGSGLFGIGPGGREHPLFQELADKPMSIVYGGNWNGAKREEILSIRDYINGWRHEQGVTYNNGESFEQYLRRVVSRILKRQK